MSTGDITDGPIVAGTDGSERGTDAVLWAADMAARRNRTLRIVHAFSALEGFGTGLPPSAEIYETIEAEAGRVLASCHDVAKAVASDLRIETAKPSSEPIPALIRESRSASMVVLGASGRGGFTGMLAGSTAVGVASHAQCPVVVLRKHEDGSAAPADGPVVVGVDGSPVSEEAIGVAYHEASLRGVPLVAVNAWLDVEYDSAFNQARLYFEGGPYEDDQERLLAERLAGWQEKYPDVHVERVVVRDRPRHQLLQRSATASLLVVGSRGRGGFSGLLLGSTSQALIHHAHCPVMIVRHERDAHRG
ncbi:universal stress protein [Prauserella flavalba]|uniref:Universal stress protein n=1 Tax=Prauserella flavalba TaxID=1477506 RepID=A0A318LVQ3_9PSEU|nr:universal stress protein [Prauserella flavalba]PXY36537.1 universal stress protein [Prauserella flavalba]